MKLLVLLNFMPFYINNIKYCGDDTEVWQGFQMKGGGWRDFTRTLELKGLK